MLSVIYSLMIGYLIGTLSPAALFAKLKKKNLRKNGTGNLGATNTMLVLGKGYGIFVMLFDIAKAVAAVKLAQILFPTLSVAGLLSGGASVVGHIYPFYLQFKGGKGLAAFGGLVLAVDGLLFLILLTVALMMMFIINYGVAVPLSAAILFPVLYGIRSGSVWAALIAAAVSLVLFANHISNIRRIKRGEDVKIRDYIKDPSVSSKLKVNQKRIEM